MKVFNSPGVLSNMHEVLKPIIVIIVHNSFVNSKSKYWNTTNILLTNHDSKLKRKPNKRYKNLMNISMSMIG